MMATSLLLRASSTLPSHSYLTGSAQKSWIISTLGHKLASLERPFSTKRPGGYNIIGIDLGTSYTRVAVMGEKNATVIQNYEGSRATPSVVAIFEQEDEILVGTLAKSKAVTNPTKTFFGIKRLIGRCFDDPQTQKMVELVPYKILKTPHHNYIDIEGDGGLTYSPNDILSSILKEMKKAAESYLGRKVHGAIITVPAYFNDAQRQAIKIVGSYLRDLDFVRIIDEPTAAALAYNYGINNKEGLIVVFDLGGATFDISILKISNGIFELKATNGDAWLGGEDFDKVVVEYLVSEFKRSEGIDLNLKEDRLALHKVREAAEEAKIQLSSKFETDIHLPFIAADKDMNITLTRSKFESLANHLIEKIRKHCESCLRDAGISSTEELDEVLLVGGMTQVPKVQQVISEIFGNKVSKGTVINPEEALALGAVKEQLLLNYNPLSLGIESRGGIFTSIIDRNAIIPTKRSQVIFYPEIDNHVRVFQGERKMASDNKLLAEFDIASILPAPQILKSSVEVTFDIDVNGILTVSAKNSNASGDGKEIKILIPPSSRELSEGVIEEMIKEGELHTETDTLIKARKLAETKLYCEEAAFSRYKDKVPAEVATKMETLLADLRNVMAKDNSDEIKDKYLDVCEAIADFKFKFCKEELSEQSVRETESRAQLLIELKKEAEAYLYCEEKVFSELFKDKLPAEVATKLESFLADLRKALDDCSYYGIRKKYLAACDAFEKFRTYDAQKYSVYSPQ